MKTVQFVVTRLSILLTVPAPISSAQDLNRRATRAHTPISRDVLKDVTGANNLSGLQ